MGHQQKHFGTSRYLHRPRSGEGRPLHTLAKFLETRLHFDNSKKTVLMGQSSSKTPNDENMALKTRNKTIKRKLDHVEINVAAEELGQALEKRRKLEAAEPYNGDSMAENTADIGKAMSEEANA